MKHHWWKSQDKGYLFSWHCVGCPKCRPDNIFTITLHNHCKEIDDDELNTRMFLDKLR